MGRDWNVEPLISFTGVRFQNPPLDTLQIFDLIDRGLDPKAADYTAILTKDIGRKDLPTFPASATLIALLSSP